MTGHSLADANRSWTTTSAVTPRLSDSGADNMDAMLDAIAAVANDVMIGAARESRQPNVMIGNKRQARGKHVDAA